MWLDIVISENLIYLERDSEVNTVFLNAILEKTFLKRNLSLGVLYFFPPLSNSIAIQRPTELYCLEMRKEQNLSER